MKDTTMSSPEAICLLPWLIDDYVRHSPLWLGVVTKFSCKVSGIDVSHSTLGHRECQHSILHAFPSGYP